MYEYDAYNISFLEIIETEKSFIKVRRRGSFNFIKKKMEANLDFKRFEKASLIPIFNIQRWLLCFYCFTFCKH